MSERTSDSKNSLEITRPFIERITDTNDVQIMGGLGTAALLQAGVEIHYDTKEVITADDFYLSARREDGSKRDVDVLVLSSDPTRIAEVEAELQQTVGKALERSVFGIRPHTSLQKQLASPQGFRVFRTFVSDRYEAESFSTGSYVKALFPFSVPIDPEALESWTLVTGEDETRIPIPHPGTTILNYTNRSISGLRPRDTEKIAKAAGNIFKQAPEIKDWIIDGPGKSQLELSTMVASLRQSNPTSISLVEGLLVNTLGRQELIEHPAFMVPESSEQIKHAIVARAAFKANGLHFFESNSVVVMLWRQFGERRAEAIVKNA
ncbi:MAG: hypothetical protein ACOH18_02775 [Candidatus Saccharimonadaceae bacterium]